MRLVIRLITLRAQRTFLTVLIEELVIVPHLLIPQGLCLVRNVLCMVVVLEPILVSYSTSELVNDGRLLERLIVVYLGFHG